MSISEPFHFDFRGEPAIWHPVKDIGDRVLCKSGSGEMVIFDKSHIHFIKLLDSCAKRIVSN